MGKKRLREGKYKVKNWPIYNKALIKRGDLSIWFSKEGLEKWYEEESENKTQGRQRKYGVNCILALMMTEILLQEKLQHYAVVI